MSAPSPLRSVEVLGVRVHDVTESEALEVLAGFIRAGGPHRVVTPNPEIVMAARSDPAYRHVLNSADLSIPDGVGVVIASRLKRTPLRAHVRGTDLVIRLAERSAREGWRWFLLGGAPGAAAEAGRRLGMRYPGFQLAGSLAASPDPADDLSVRRAISEAGPVDVLLVAYGAPAQERWIARNERAVGAAVQVGVGGVFNFLSGRSPRAPGWVRRLELEWAYRLATERWRWRRQLALPAFTVLALAEAVQGPKSKVQRPRSGA